MEVEELQRAFFSTKLRKTKEVKTEYLGARSPR